jgi:hypothetical protein
VAVKASTALGEPGRVEGRRKVALAIEQRNLGVGDGLVDVVDGGIQRECVSAPTSSSVGAATARYLSGFQPRATSSSASLATISLRAPSNNRAHT